ncbi:FK506-binding protein 5-like [Helianthus annuus]|uniref:FK506-binding protein 5-like n=1 Tax=Helianthus annuus TaxID=4232 RepID=UPI001652EE94|nr:FK506-binding protein 5-like [Helianthus annuus]
MKQLEDAPKEKSRALAVIHDDEGFDWSELFPEEDAVGYAFMTKIVPFKDTRTEEVKYINRKVSAQFMKNRIYQTWKEAKRANRWDAIRECYLDPKGNIAIDPDYVSVETLTEQIAEEEEARQRMWWGGGEAEEKEKEKEKEKESQLKKVNDGIIDTTKEFTVENLKKMADKVLAAKELEVVSESGTESKSKVSPNDSTDELGKKAKTESDCKKCMKNCKVCSTLAYLNSKKTEELTGRIRDVENQILSRDKMLKASNDRLKDLTEKIENDKIDVERIRKENKKLIHENRVLRSKEEQINQQLDEIAKLKLQFQESKIENESINLKLNSYNFASFVLPKPIGKNKVGEDVYSDGTGVGYHKLPPSVLNNFSKKKSGLVNDEEVNEVKLPESIDVIFSPSSDEDSVQSEVVKSYTMPPQNPGDSWRFNYDTLWESFDMEEEPEFFDELDILREYELSQERFPAEYYRRQRQTSNDDEVGPSNAGEHDDIQQSSEQQHAPENQTAVNDNLESDDRPVFDRGDSDSKGE